MTSEAKQAQFKEWLRKVDVALMRMCGLSHTGLAGNNYWDMFEDEVSPQEAAEVVLEDNGFDLNWLD